MFQQRTRAPRAFNALIFALVAPGLTGASPVKTPKLVPVTDATVTERVTNIRTKADHLALAEYYLAKARAEEPRIDYYDKLFRAYMAIEGRDAEVFQRQARALLKAARMSKQHDELLAEAHKNRAWQWND